MVAYVDGVAVSVDQGISLLEMCDSAGRYVPRMCYHSSLAAVQPDEALSFDCGLCLVRIADGSVVRACSTSASEGARVTTDDEELRKLRAERLAVLLAEHPHVCLGCPDREGCARDQCAHGHPVEARCCEEMGRCEFGKVVAFVDPQALIPRRVVSVSRSATTEGRIRREPGLCVGCGRCVRLCSTSAAAADALEMGGVALPKEATLRESGCSFCGLCVLVCPTGALTAPGPAGATWLASRSEKHQLPLHALPPEERRYRIPEEAPALPATAGVLTLLDDSGEVLRIAGVADLAAGLAETLKEPAVSAASWYRYEEEPLYTQRETELLARYAKEHGKLPAGNDLGEDLFGDVLD